MLDVFELLRVCAHNIMYSHDGDEQWIEEQRIQYNDVFTIQDQNYANSYVIK